MRLDRQPRAFVWKWAMLLILAALLTGGLALFWLSNGHIREYLTWRWMVTFKVPITQVDDYRILVAKSKHQLVVYKGNQEVRTYRVGLSEHGLAARQIWEDELTPEGGFLVASMQYESRFGPRQMLLETTAQSLAAYELQYGVEGQMRLKAWNEAHGILDTIWEVYDFNEVYAEVPIWNDILIHGGGSERDWTWGCIALDDADMIELFDTIRSSAAGGLGVVVEIRP